MKKTPPPRIIGLFAEAAPICVILRRGPSAYTLQILWNTDTDEFTAGQWVRGRVDYATLSSDGKYMAVGLMGAKSRIGSWEDTQLGFVCRPPYFAALELWVGGLCYTTIAFLKDDVLFVSGRESTVNSKTPCPFPRSSVDQIWPVERHHDYTLNASVEPVTGKDQQGRTVKFGSGCVYVVEDGKDRLLLDTSVYHREDVLAPDWAKDW